MKKIIKSRYIQLCALCELFYMAVMLVFYITKWEVPDFTAYVNFAIGNAKAYDGFSSLFLLVAGLASFIPQQIKILCLLCNPFAIAMMFCFYYNVVKKDEKELTVQDVMVVLIITFSSFWYYGYGKVFYDIPFTMLNFGICMYLLTKCIVMYRSGEVKILHWNLLFFSAGLCLSWKAYNIFLIAGMALLILADDELRNICIDVIFKVRRILCLIAMFILGYIAGNYNILFFPKETLEGIRGYEASSNFLEKLFSTYYAEWDHINTLPWNYSVMFFVTAIIILFILPVVIKKARYAFISAFMLGCFYVFITFFSRGYPWHGFTFGLFIVLMFLIEVKNYKNGKMFNRIALFAIIIQVILCTSFYIPKQIKWQIVTEKSIEDLIDNEMDIRRDVLEAIELVDDATFSIDISIKRYTMIYNNISTFNKLSRENVYLVRSSVEFVDPLKYANYDVWNSIYGVDNYVNNESEYIIYIIPNRFKIMSDMARLHNYDGMEIICRWDREEYSVILYKR